MPFTGNLVNHPAQFSEPILERIRPILAGYADTFPTVFDCFGGLGTRLGALCDQLGLTFAGVDIEEWPERDPRIVVGDCRDAAVYPATPFALVTSPPYWGNRISSDYVDGPLETTKLNGRRSYGTSLGRALHPDNLARTCRKTKPHEIDFYIALARTARHWGGLAVLNVDMPMMANSRVVLEKNGYELVDVIKVETQRYRGGAGSDKRAEYEIILVGVR